MRNLCWSALGHCRAFKTSRQNDGRFHGGSLQQADGGTLILYISTRRTCNPVQKLVITSEELPVHRNCAHISSHKCRQKDGGSGGPYQSMPQRQNWLLDGPPEVEDLQSRRGIVSHWIARPYNFASHKWPDIATLSFQVQHFIEYDFCKGMHEACLMNSHAVKQQ